MIYLDSAASMRPLPCALAAFHAAPFANPSSSHALGLRARDALEQSRTKIASMLDCAADELYFCSTATEAAMWTIHSLHGIHQIISSPVEHHAILENIPRDFPYDAYLTARAQMYGNNETGAIIDYTKLEKRYDLIICDATASVGHIPVSFKNLDCDYLLADGIKFGSIPGAAILIARHGAPLSPLIRGGGQERGMRGGTENLPAICAMAAALEWQIEHIQENTEHITALRSLMVDLLSDIPGHQWNTLLDRPTLPHILNVSFDGVENHALALALSRAGIMVSTGAACSSGNQAPSHVLMAVFGDEARARSAIRISLGHDNTDMEIRFAAQKIAECVAFLRGIG